MKQDTHQRAKERYQDARDALREQHARMLEDLKFSNPSDPQQWPEEAKKARSDRPCLTFDRTNQFVMQVVNDARQNKPSIHCLPVDSASDIEVAKKINGMIRHIEYVSRAGIAYDTALEHAARIGLGWLRVLPEVIRPDTNEQEIRIKRIHDPFSVCIDPNSTDPTGSDAMFGFVETDMTKAAFKALYPKAACEGMGEQWSGVDTVKLCEYFDVVETEENRIIVVGEDGARQMLAEEDYWKQHSAGAQMQVGGTAKMKVRSVKWRKMNGVEILEETDFPSQYLPLVSVIGYEQWIEGKRYLCGMVRRLRDGQMAYNYERSAFIEAVALQPKAPFVAAWEGIEQFEDQWRKANRSNDSYLPYNHLDEAGNPIPAPQRQAPPAFPAAFAQGGQIAVTDMEASVGMYKSNLGQQSNAQSGRAKREDKESGDVANFHYLDNMHRGIEQLGRVVVDMLPRVIDTARQVRILGEDDTHSFVQVSPQMPGPARKDQNNKVVAINLNVGAYDVRVVTGPSYTTVRQEAAQNIVEISQGNPQLGAALAPLLMKMREMPESEKAYKVALALLPPPVQEAYKDDAQAPDPAQMKAQMDGMKQHMDQLTQMLQQADKEVDRLKEEQELKLYDAETKRMAALSTGMQPEQVQALVMRLLQQALSGPPPGMEQEMQPESAEYPPQQMPPGMPGQQDEMNEPPQGGFSLPSSQPPPDLPQSFGMNP